MANIEGRPNHSSRKPLINDELTSANEAADTRIATLSTASNSSMSLFRLSRELRDYIYTYVSFTEPAWIGSPPLIAGQQAVIVEKKTVRQPATFIKTRSRIVLASREVRDEFRTAVWRSLMKSDRQVDLRLHDFTPTPLSNFFAGCSPFELQKLLEKEKCRLHVHLTESLRPHIRLPGSTQEDVVFLAWVAFCREIGLETRDSFDDGDDCFELMLTAGQKWYRQRCSAPAARLGLQPCDCSSSAAPHNSICKPSVAGLRLYSGGATLLLYIYVQLGILPEISDELSHLAVHPCSVLHTSNLVT